MKILIVNDDGIHAEGIERLARTAAELGEVWVAAPKKQCSAMSHRITVFDSIEVRKVDFPVSDVHAYSVDGTPADCVKVALSYLLPEKPDIVLSGINFGYNTGVDILYSGTVGAAMQALVNGIPAIALSGPMGGGEALIEKHLKAILTDLMGKRLPENMIWNVNFPDASPEELKGILWNRVPAKEQFFKDNYIKKDMGEDSFELQPSGTLTDWGPEGSDIRAVLDGYISIGTIRNEIM